MRHPTLQVVGDLHGVRVEKRHIYWIESCIKVMLGEGKLHGSFWVTRIDLAEQFISENLAVQHLTPNRNQIDGDRFHEPSFDLYLPGELVPIGRLVNVAIPEAG